MRARTSVAAAILFAALLTPALAAEPAPGRVVEVTCKANAGQRYSCYVPKAYTPDRPWPILYCFSPNARGDAFVQRYKDVCEKRGWIVVGSMNSKNGPWGPIKASIEAMLPDTEARFTLSKTMRYASGFSGGSRVSFEVASLNPKTISGVIGIGADWGGAKMPRAGLAVFIMCGESDFNRRELDAFHQRLEKAGNPVVYKTFPGGHEMPPVALMTEAVEWMDDQAAERKVGRFTKGVEKAKAVAEAEPVKAWLSLLDLLGKYPDVEEGRAEARELKKSLERDPGVKKEAAALSKYESALAWIEKNADRIAKSKSALAQAVKKLRNVVKRHAGTRAAFFAEAKLKAIGND